MSNLTRALLILALAAGLVFAGWWARGQRLGAEATRALAEAAASADTLARMRGERQVAQRRADSLAVAVQVRDSVAAAVRGEVDRLATRVRVTADSLRRVEAVSVSIEVYREAVELAEIRGEQVASADSTAAILRKQVRAGGRLLALADSVTEVWQGRALRAEGLLRSGAGPSTDEGWSTGAYVALGAVTAGSCSESVASRGCIAGLLVLLSRF